ncbi:putative nucleic-acid-binding protein containing a Zn-ribbon [Saccharomonospora marina XMU15]|uniref:Putative nucleic-acid-binding protein containing a Zn-ribbon n=1 Tax=Saccharomonospora marina XMU15 TaxID=882083 RepID=H5XBJ2_9PSEU|nr:OB-fold nucleic acid binding domain-containing protein [Saccharomonospora marina]EHR50500.1 putative nucleic-acid-binding protein containing a Zn-ribbon [Saccharomonospora marina XMU15]
MNPAATETEQTPLSAPLNVGFDYTRSVGPVLGHFVNALRQRRIVGIRGSDGRVHVPPVEYDPHTAEALTEFADVADEGTVVSWSWAPEPLEGQPIQRPFAWALIRLDGADTALLHAVDAGSATNMRTGMRVRVRWADEPVGHIRDIAYFVPVDAAPDDPAPTPPPPPVAEREEGSPVTTVVTPIHLSFQHSVSAEESRYLRGLAEGRLIGQRCPACEKVYIPPRGACPTDGVPTVEEVELPDTGIVTTFCIVNVPFLGQRIKPPYVAAYILLDGADIPFLHLVLGCDASEVRMGMRVRAAWKPREEWSTTLENIAHFEPSGEPDAPYESYAHHL